MATLATDPFNRSNGDLTGDSGWIAFGTHDSLKISSNAVVRDVDPSANAYDGGIAWADDQWAECTVSSLSGAVDNGGGVMVRAQAGATTCYIAVVSGDGTVSVGKYVAGAYTHLATTAGVFFGGERVRLEAVGGTLRVYYNGLQLGSDISDSSIASGGRPGLIVKGAVGHALDAFAAGDFSALSNAVRTTLASDSFTRADSANLGTNWVVGPLPMKLASNQCVPTSTGEDEYQVYDDGTFVFPTDQWAEATMFVVGGGAGTGPCLVLRGPDAFHGANFYRWAVAPLGSNAIDLTKSVSGVVTSIATINVAWVSGDVLRVEAEGSTLRTYRNGVLVDTHTDTSVVSGRPGVGYSSVNTSAAIDDWSAGSLVSGPPPGPVTAPGSGGAAGRGGLMSVS